MTIPDVLAYSPLDLLQEYFKSSRLLQLATTGQQGQPWICTVYFVADPDNNLYWLSYPTRRHSQDIANNNQVASTIVVKSDLPVIGIQLEGTATVVDDKNVIATVMKQYVAKYDSGKTFYERFIAGDNKHIMYKLEPKHIYLFDEVNNSLNDRQEIK